MATEIVGESNGHRWIKANWLRYATCAKCGILRKPDDTNKPCPGVVPVTVRVN